MDMDKARSLSDTELEDALREAKQDLWGARFALSTRQLKDYSTIPQTRRTIARVVSVERLARHRLYKRVIRLSTKFKAHDEANDAHIGDTVEIEESRPLSATKRWRLVSVLARAGEHGHGLPGETVVEEEAEVIEAIHAAAHP